MREGGRREGGKKEKGEKEREREMKRIKEVETA